MLGLFRQQCCASPIGVLYAWRPVGLESFYTCLSAGHSVFLNAIYSSVLLCASNRRFDVGARFDRQPALSHYLLVLAFCINRALASPRSFFFFSYWRLLFAFVRHGGAHDVILPRAIPRSDGFRVGGFVWNSGAVVFWEDKTQKFGSGAGFAGWPLYVYPYHRASGLFYFFFWFFCPACRSYGAIDFFNLRYDFFWFTCCFFLFPVVFFVFLLCFCCGQASRAFAYFLLGPKYAAVSFISAPGGFLRSILYGLL